MQMNKDCEVTIEGVTPKKFESNRRMVAKTDSIVDGVVDQLISRAQVGMGKYKTNLDREDLGIIEWLDHLQQELLDGANYIQKLKVMLGGKKGTPTD